MVMGMDMCFDLLIVVGKRGVEGQRRYEVLALLGFRHNVTLCQ